jgi:hypothetical protein
VWEEVEDRSELLRQIEENGQPAAEGEAEEGGPEEV